jgi:hypothetical protein
VRSHRDASDIHALDVLLINSGHIYPQEANSKMNLAIIPWIGSSSRLLESITAPVCGCWICFALWYQLREMREMRVELREMREMRVELLALSRKVDKIDTKTSKMSRTMGNIGNSIGVLTESAIRLTQQKHYGESYLQSCRLKTVSDVATHCSRIIEVKTTESGERIEEEAQRKESCTGIAQAMLASVKARMGTYLDELSIAMGNGPDTAFVLNGCIASDIKQRLKHCAKTMRDRACSKIAGGDKTAALHFKAVESVSRYFSLLANSDKEAEQFLIDGGGDRDGLGLMIYLSAIATKSQKLFQREIEMDCRGRIILEAPDANNVILTVESAEIKLGSAKGHEASEQLNLQLRLIHSALVPLYPLAEFKLVGRIFFAKKSGYKIMSETGPPAIQILPEDGVLSSKTFSRAELGLDDESFEESGMPLEVTSITEGSN